MKHKRSSHSITIPEYQADEKFGCVRFKNIHYYWSSFNLYNWLIWFPLNKFCIAKHLSIKITSNQAENWLHQQTNCILESESMIPQIKLRRLDLQCRQFSIQSKSLLVHHFPSSLVINESYLSVFDRQKLDWTEPLRLIVRLYLIVSGNFSTCS